MTDSHHRRNGELYEALLALRTPKECELFLKDLCTPQELAALKDRFRVCQLLDAGEMSYRQIHEVTGASLVTIGRVARFLREEAYGGYRLILNRLTKGGSS